MRWPFPRTLPSVAGADGTSVVGPHTGWSKMISPVITQAAEQAPRRVSSAVVMRGGVLAADFVFSVRNGGDGKTDCRDVDAVDDAGADRGVVLVRGCACGSPVPQRGRVQGQRDCGCRACRCDRDDCGGGNQVGPLTGSPNVADVARRRRQ